jgi:flagellar protein FlaH
MQPNHYDLGLEGRDRVNPSLGGGLPTGATVLLEGGHGAGKSVITQRMAYGLCETGTQVTYVSTEDTAQDFVSQMDSLNYPVVEHLLNEQLLFLHADVDTRDTFDGDMATSKAEQRQLLKRLMRASVMWRSDVVIVDGFDEILLHDPDYERIQGAEDQDDIMQNLISFFRRVSADGTSIVLTANPASLSEQALRPIRNVSDVFLELSMEQVGSEVRRKMIVRKFGGMDEQVDDNVGYAVQSNRGLTIVTRTVA